MSACTFDRDLQAVSSAGMPFENGAVWRMLERPLSSNRLSSTAIRAPRAVGVWVRSAIRASWRTTAVVRSAIEAASLLGEGSRLGIPHGTRAPRQDGGPRYPSTL
jgi:hypothetical protein